MLTFSLDIIGIDIVKILDCILGISTGMVSFISNGVQP